MAQEVYTVKQSTLGSCIRTLRMQNNLTQLQLAELLGVTDKAVSKWERDLSYSGHRFISKDCRHSRNNSGRAAA